MIVLRVCILLIALTACAPAKILQVHVEAEIGDSLVAYVGGRNASFGDCWAGMDFVYHDSSNFRALQQKANGPVSYDVVFTPHAVGTYHDTIIAHWGWGMSRCGDPRDDRDTIYIEGVATDSAATVETLEPRATTLNLINGRLEVRLSQRGGRCSIMIVDLLGHSVFRRDLNVNEGSASIVMPSLPPSVYYAMVMGESTVTGRFILTR